MRIYRGRTRCCAATHIRGPVDNPSNLSAREPAVDSACELSVHWARLRMAQGFGGLPEDATGTSDAQEQVRMMDTLRKAGAVGPGLVASTLLVTVLGAGLPDAAGAALAYGGLSVAILLCLGTGERTAVRLLFRARTLTTTERTALAPIVTSLCQLGLGPPLIHLYAARRPGAAEATAVGRRSVIVSQELVMAVQARRIPPGEALALVVHASALARAGITRSDPAIEFWSLPWTVVRMLTRPFSPRRGLFAFAWKGRFVIIGLAIYQFATDGPPVIGPVFAGMTTLLLLLSYASPVWRRSWRAYLTAAGDRAVAEHGLGPALATYLRRFPVTQERADRIQLLEGTSTRPQLRLVSI